MDSWIKDLWNNNKILFFVLIPLILLIFLKDLILDLVIGSARKISNEAKKKDESLKAEQEQAEREANQKKKEADDLGKKADSVEVDEDWHKKK